MQVRTLLLFVSAVLLAGCSSTARRVMEESRVKVHQEPLELRSEANVPKAYIDVTGGVTIDKEPLAITTEQRAAILDYREASLAIIDISFDAASRLTRYAVPRLLLGSMIHGSDGASRGIDADAEKIAHSPAFCAALDKMRQTQDVMVAREESLRPYARLTAQNVLDCQAGKPYRYSM
ncbi:hypothetical protein [Dyella sp. 2RAB6]|uniref:hypothetical protein n=1 Tax=Dyella sp. 2RAB6 TaxID=3232992 RepID=UPI003F8DFBB7